MQYKLIITPCDDDHWDNQDHENAVNMFLGNHTVESVRTHIHVTHNRSDNGSNEAYVTEILYKE